jgi:hypothetical protein
MDDNRPAKVQETLADIAQGRHGNELVFDPSTGQLVSTNRPNPDAVVATNTADEGYFR